MAILTYHHIGTCPLEQKGHAGLWVTPEQFRGQLEYLCKRGYVAIGLDKIHAHLQHGERLPRKWVAITFDDGWRDNFSAALPVLKEFALPATVFPVTGSIRNGPPTGRWDDYLSAEEIRFMMTEQVEFGSHTVTHPRLAKLSKEEVMRELEVSRDALSRVTGEPPEWLCYPYGSFAPWVADLARTAGYVGALSTIRDNRIRRDQLFWLPRVMVMGDTSPERLGYMLSSVYHYVHAWKNRRRWKSIK